MNPRPPQSPNSLDAEEHALVKALPRLHGRSAPSPDLDARILAAAQAAVQPAKPAHTSARPRIRWIAPAALAASMVLAVGMAWHLRPLPTLKAPQPVAQEDAISEQAVPMVEPPANDKPVPMVAPESPVAQPTLPARQQVSPSAANPQQALPARDDRQPQAPIPLLSPPAPPAPPAPAPPSPAAMAARASPPTESRANGMLQTQASQEAMRARPVTPASSANTMTQVQGAAAATADKTSAADSARSAAPSPARPAPATAEVRNEAEMAADAGFVDAPEEDIPPATAASPAVRDAWLRRISQLLEQGKRQDAKASLAEFKRRYPNAVLPPALHGLDSEP